MMTLLFFKQRKTRNLIILLTPEGVSVSLMGFPSNLNRTTPSFNPWEKKKKYSEGLQILRSKQIYINYYSLTSTELLK